ncbi:MAG TPA: transcriptional regulator [Caulobacteraceae bacterium]|nr:transcriptional regulator [Caulobacteraceae bacterium]
MPSGGFRFDRFVLDPGDRQLRRDGAPVELNARYLDALILLVREQGKLVSKDRFLDEVWRGVPVTDEALTQCVRMLRNRLGDDATNPRFIETVPKYGYRFVAAVEPFDDAVAAVPGTSPVAADPGEVRSARSGAWDRFVRMGAAGLVGGGAAGLGGGLVYGLVWASLPGVGAVSALLVLVCVSGLIGALGGAGVGFGVAAADYATGRPGWRRMIGGAAGGMIVGGAVKLLGTDAFTLLLGRSPGEITGAPEGVLIGAAAGLGAWLAGRDAGSPSLRRAVGAAGLAGLASGLLISAMGGRLMAGSLDLLARGFPGSRLRLDQVGALFGENGFGPISLTVTAAVEASLFCACVVGAMILARRRLDGGDRPDGS